MCSKTTRRGFVSGDKKWFSPDAVLLLKQAQEEIKWLLDRDYKMPSIIEMVGNHYQFSSRQRNALQRATSSEACIKNRNQKLLLFSKAEEDCIYIDGFNLIITLEVALSDGILIACNDGTIRDIAGLRGTYSIIDKTCIALDFIGKEFSKLNVPCAKFYLDSAVSNSGRLKALISEQSKIWQTAVQVELVPNADPILSKMDRVVTTDSIILNNCKTWFNLGRKIIEDYIPDANIISLGDYTHKNN